MLQVKNSTVQQFTIKTIDIDILQHLGLVIKKLCDTLEQKTNLPLEWEVELVAGLITRGGGCMHTCPHKFTSVQVCINHMHDFLCKMLQKSLTETLMCLKLYLWKTKHLSFKKIFAANLIVFRFHYLIFYLKNDLFSI